MANGSGARSLNWLGERAAAAPTPETSQSRPAHASHGARDGATHAQKAYASATTRALALGLPAALARAKHSAAVCAHQRPRAAASAPERTGHARGRVA